LSFTVGELSELKENNRKLYEKVRHTLGDESQVLNIKIGNKNKIIPIEDINRIDANDYCVNLITKNYRSYAMRISMKVMVQQLPSYFLRVHRKSIVNMKMVTEVVKNGNHLLILKDLSRIPVSKSRMKLVNDYFAYA
jgi:DNA-binding LytR/AlgR family response regulator